MFLELSESAWPSPQLDFGLKPSGTVRQQISVAFSYIVCGNFSWQPQKINTRTLNFHTFKYTIQCCVIFRVVPLLPALEHFRFSQKIPPVGLQPVPIPLCPEPQATTNLLSVPIDLLVLDFPCQWNHIIDGLLLLASFISMFPRFIHVKAGSSPSFCFMGD